MTVHTDRDDRGVVTITLDRPKTKNALDADDFAALGDALAPLGPDGTRAVLLTGTGGNFCSGADLGSQREDKPANPVHGMRRVGQTVTALHDCPVPTVAKVDGFAVGAGLNLALGCDLVVATDRARFSEIFPRRGLSIDGGGSWILPRLIGLARAKELAFLGDMITAEEAESLGLINRVVAPEELDAAVDDLVTRLAAGPTLALGLTKKLLNQSTGSTMAEAVEAEAVAQAMNFATADTVEGFRAFLERREPEFKGY